MSGTTGTSTYIHLRTCVPVNAPITVELLTPITLAAFLYCQIFAMVFYLLNIVARSLSVLCPQCFSIFIAGQIKLYRSGIASIVEEPRYTFLFQHSVVTLKKLTKLELPPSANKIFKL